ncbi:hypothetical protein SLEP1_g13053 [Rubroshorea leprosula]|uniref:Leucine-rich repeat protein n=1 Tax=Rubroshorea leprosula TaxID=152421 RepID=A0AAV5INQ0_9ROSI|nr:hypothetical protein SLEP1_g13053 [Rubroshorea leprosula]
MWWCWMCAQTSSSVSPTPWVVFQSLRFSIFQETFFNPYPRPYKIAEELNCNFNLLSKLPDNIGYELVNLEKLRVNSNMLVFLPQSVAHLTSLRVLDTRLNCLRSLPQDLENLINLEVLNVSQNFQYLDSIPYSVGFLISLVELDVSYNKITTLPDSMGCLGKLQKLCVGRRG